MHGVDAYLAQRGLWGGDGADRPPFCFTRFYAGLVQNRRLTPSQIAEMTLPEALLYTVPLEEKGSETTQQAAWEKLRVLATLPVEDHLALALIRSGR